ncbi:hypothetical protein HDU96_005317, partial [Phlyctochytrium bullatum]
MAAKPLCCTADPTWGETQMLLNVTVKYEDNANIGRYNVTVTFPTTYQMGPQPFRAPIGNVRCEDQGTLTGLRTFRCSSTSAQNFFAVFNMITPNKESPKNGAKIVLNTIQGTNLDCPVAAWCPDVGSFNENASEGGSTGMPTWQITVIASGCGIALGIFIFVFAKYRTRPQRETGPVHTNTNNPVPGGAQGTLLAKVAEAQRARAGVPEVPSGAEKLMEKVAEARNKSESEKKESGVDGLPPGPGTLLERVAEAKRLKSLQYQNDTSSPSGTGRKSSTTRVKQN